MARPVSRRRLIWPPPSYPSGKPPTPHPPGPSPGASLPPHVRRHTWPPCSTSFLRARHHHPARAPGPLPVGRGYPLYLAAPGPCCFGRSRSPPPCNTPPAGPAPKHQHQHQHHWKPNLATYLNSAPSTYCPPAGRGEPPRTPPSPPARLLPPLAHPALSFRFITPARCHPANSSTSQQVGKPTNRQAGKPKSRHTPPTTSTTGDHLTRLNPPPTYTPSCALTLPPGKRKTLRLPPPLCYPPTSHRQQGRPPPVTRPNVPPPARLPQRSHLIPPPGSPSCARRLRPALIALCNEHTMQSLQAAITLYPLALTS